MITAADIPQQRQVTEPITHTRRTVLVEGYVVVVTVHYSGWANVSIEIPAINPGFKPKLEIGMYSVPNMHTPEFINEINQCIVRVAEAAKALGVKPEQEPHRA
jgi:hypothetical protein